MPIQSILQQEPGSAQTSDPNVVPVVTGGLDKYEQGQAIGKGGYAVVYRGKRKSDGLSVAIKRVDIADMAPKKRDRCIKEVHLLQQLNHPHIITMYDAFIDQNQLIIITEWAPGGDLKKLIRRMADAGKRFEEPEIWQCFLQIVDGLRGMHAARILHRDMKPANVLVCADGVLKLGDLGLGRKLGPQTVDVLSKVGTPYYVSPEVVKGVKYDFKSDMWSTGCLLYELAMLKSPFETEGANLYDVFSKIGKGEYQPLSADRFSPALRSMVNSLLAQHPMVRPTAEQVWEHGQVILQQVSQQQAQQLQQQQRPKSQQGPPVQQPEPQQQLRRQTTSVNRRQQDPSLGDVALMSEYLVSTLLVIAADPTSSSSSQNPDKKHRNSSSSAADLVLRCLHPLLFAQPLAAFGRGAGSHLPQLLQDEQAQQLQLGMAVQVASWLAKLHNKLDAAQALDAELQPGQRSAGSNSKQQSNVRPCKDCQRAAEALRRAAQGMGVQGLEAVTAAELSAGHGRAVCVVLQGMADAAYAHLQLVCRPPKAASATDMYIEELLEDEQDAAADIAAAAAVDAPVADTSTDLDQHLAADLYSSPQQQLLAGVIGGPGSQQPTAAGHQTAIKSQVDVVAWRAEVERLAPQLTKINMPAAAHSTQTGLTQEWLARWQSTKQLQQQLVELAGHVSSSLPTVQQKVSSDMERLVQTEERLNRLMLGPLGQYAELQQQVEHVLQQRRDSEESLMTAQQQLQQVASRLEEVQQQIAEKTDKLQGTVLLQRQRTAVQSLKTEIQQMETRLGLLMHQLIRCKRQNT